MKQLHRESRICKKTPTSGNAHLFDASMPLLAPPYLRVCVYILWLRGVGGGEISRWEAR